MDVVIWDFDTDAAGTAPQGFTAVEGRWAVEADDEAPSAPNVVVGAGGGLVADRPELVDFVAQVRCTPDCGLVFRFQDSENYDVAWVNVAERRVVVHQVIAGQRTQLASTPLYAWDLWWHTLEVQAHGREVLVSWDANPVLATQDVLLTEGRVGLWSRRGEVRFDDLVMWPDPR